MDTTIYLQHGASCDEIKLDFIPMRNDTFTLHGMNYTVQSVVHSYDSENGSEIMILLG